MNADPRQPHFDAARAKARALGDPRFSDREVILIDAALDVAGVPRAVETAPPPPIGHNRAPATGLTLAIVLEILEHEAVIFEAYRDSRGIWTWSGGVTSDSGHQVERYKDNPQPLSRCLEVYLWLLRTQYLPDVLEAFAGVELAEHELGGALSFHWNTGAIRRADWVRHFREGRRDAARQAFMNWRTPPEIIPRRKLERDLFFDGRWTSDGLITVYDVAKPSYRPKWSSARQLDIRAQLAAALEHDA